MAIYMMVSFSGGVVGVKHRPTASNWQTMRATMHHSNLLEKKKWIVYKNLSNEFRKQFGWDKIQQNEIK